MTPSLQEQLQRSLGAAYLLERELGGGGMSQVFLALENALGRRVVVKVLLPELAAGVNVDRFRREIQLAAQLQHPHIVPLLSAGESEGLPFFIMPFVAGESLRARLAREGELPIPETVRILRDVVSALAHAHAHGVVHRDVKPDNVLLSGGVAVVTDFGVAKAVTASTDPGGHTGLTSLGVALGTPAYMAPEQATASPMIDHRADIYALGAMAFEMLTGMPPFAGRTAQAVLAAHVVEDPEPVERRRPVVPPSLATLVNACLAKRPADRPQSANQVLHLLDAIVTPTGGTAPTTAVKVQSGTQFDNRRRWPLVASLAALAVLVGAGVLWLRPTSADKVNAVAPPPAATPLPSTDSVIPPQQNQRAAPVTEPSAPPVPPAQPDQVPPKPDRGPPAQRQRFRPELDPDVAPRAVEPQPPADSAAMPPREAPAPAPVAPSAETLPTAVAPPVPAAPPPAAPAPPPDPRPEIRNAVAEYAAAVEAQSLPKLQLVYPGMTEAQQRGWEQFFQLVREVKAQLTISRLDVSNATAEAQISGTYTYLNTSTERTENQPVSFRATLRRDDGRWRMIQVR